MLIVSYADYRQRGPLGKECSLKIPDYLLTSAGFLISKLSQRLLVAAADALKDLGVQARHVGVLAFLDENGAATQKSIGETLGIDRTTVVLLVDELESFKLAKRDPHPDDRRATLVSITKKGRETLRKSKKVIAEVEAAFFKKLHREEQLRFVKSLLTLFDQGELG